MSNRQYEPTKYVFTQAEIVALGDQLAREAHSIVSLRAQKKSLVADLNAQIETASTRELELADKISNGYEMRDVETMTLLDTPRPGMKRVLRVDTNAILREEQMTLQELQGSFGFDPTAEPPPDSEAGS